MADGSSISRIPAHQEESYIVVPGRADCGLIVLCDHAGNAFRRAMARWGCPRSSCSATSPTTSVRRTSRASGAHASAAPAVMTRYSRLLIDPNRGTDDPTLIMRLSDGAVVPGNRSDRCRRARAGAFGSTMRPTIAPSTPSSTNAWPAAVEPMLLSIHSFTESWKTVARPWHVGVLWTSDLRLAKPLLEGFRAEGDLIVGDNEPYSGQLEGDCLWQHGAAARAGQRHRRDQAGL